MSETVQIKRKTKETDISLNFSLHGSGNSDIITGIGFLNHMLTLFTVHGFFDLYLKASGDIDVDFHHSVEDIGICLGKAIGETSGNIEGMRRYGSAIVPMDETLAEVHLDLCKRPYIVFNATFTRDKIGDFDTELFQEFFRAVAVNSGMTLHINVRYGTNNHHMAEAIFKAFGQALNMATSHDNRVKGVLSSKGSL